MNKIYQSCTWIFLLLVTLSSCTDDIDDNLHLLRQIDEIAVDGTSSTTTISYTGNRILSINNDVSRTDFYYTSSLITRSEEVNLATNKVITLQYLYTNDQLVKITSSENYVINYIHNSDGTVFYEKIAKDSNNADVKIYHGTLYFQNSNLKKEEMILDNTAANVISKNSVTFEYDAKNNPLQNIIGFSKLLQYSKSVSLNNSTISTEESEVKYTDTNQIISSLSRNISEYVYNSLDYPTEMISEKAVIGNGGNSTRVKSILYYK